MQRTAHHRPASQKKHHAKKKKTAHPHHTAPTRNISSSRSSLAYKNFTQASYTVSLNADASDAAKDQQVRPIHTLKNVYGKNITKQSFNELQQYLPPRDHPEYALRRNWISHLLTHKHTLLPDFVAQLGRAVHIVDIRDEEELLGPVGYIRGTNWFPKAEIDKITTSFPKDGLIAVVCSNDSESREVVRALKNTGHNLAAIVAGGMRSFKLMGLTSSRNPAILDRRCVPISVMHHNDQQRKMLESNKMGQKQMTLEQIIGHLGTGDNVQFIKVAAFLTHGRLSCIDGRDDSGVIGAPGGDMGEFIIHLSTIEQLTGTPLTESQITTLFQRRLDAFGRFYMHTDQDSSDRVVKALCDEVDQSIAEKVRDVPGDFALHSILLDVKKSQLEQVLDILTRPEHLGCGHLKFMLTNSEKYRVREGLVRSALKTFFRTRYQGATECDYIVLSGVHEECGVANITLKKEIHSYTKIPLISPSISHKQIFVNHGEISKYLRHQQCEWFLEQTDVVPLSKTAASAFHALVDLQAEHHAGQTVAKLAHNLPMYTLEFDDDRASCVITYNGLISGPDGDQKKIPPPLPIPQDHQHGGCSHGHHHATPAQEPAATINDAPPADAPATEVDISQSIAPTPPPQQQQQPQQPRVRSLDCVDGTSKATVRL